VTRPERAFAFRSSGFMIIYVAINFAAIGGVFDTLNGPWRWALSLAVSLPIAGQIWTTLAFMRDSDEFVRALTAKRFIVASGAAMALFSAWGFAEGYAQAPHAPGWLIYALFWSLYGVLSPMIRNSR